MIFHDNDKEHFETIYKSYMIIFLKYDDVLKNQYKCELGLRIRDSTINDRIVFNVVKLNSNIEVNLLETNEILSKLQTEIESTCNICGNIPAKWIELDHRYYEVNQMVLCNNCITKHYIGSSEKYLKENWIAKFLKIITKKNQH
jgi:hypothetical protein